jgi:hypothetical protein
VTFPATVNAPAGAYLCLFAPAAVEVGMTVTPVVGAGAGGAPLHTPAIPVRTPSLEELLTPTL